VILRLKERRLRLAEGKPLVMGIVNLGPDSVADDWSLPTLSDQLARAQGLLQAGADIIDIGVQSGRTDTEVMSEDDELERLSPLVGALARKDVLVSVDTWRPGVVQGAVEAGASLVNDVSGLADERVADIAARTGAGLVLMHTRAQPKQERFPEYVKVVEDVRSFLGERSAAAVARGVAPEQIILDPGLDFAKTPVESIEVLRRLAELRALGRPILLAVSRKYFVGMLTAREPLERLAGTLAAVGHGVNMGARIVRVHDVAAVTEFLAVRAALLTDGAPELRGDPDAEELKWLLPKDPPR
jgi:dihydropteroate synthase